jgi:hypothetical protein
MAQLLQENRFEYKYLIDDLRALAVRDFVRFYLRPDAHADPAHGYAYPIHSVYLDDGSLSLFQATVDGLKNRFKLRARYYNGDPAAPVFFEIKRRVNDAILKQRARVHRRHAPGLIDGAPPGPECLVNPGSLKDRKALEGFCRLRDELGAAGRVIVSYRREAWVTPDDNNARLTLDRDLRAVRWEGRLDAEVLEHGEPVPMEGVVLELKFTGRFPEWMHEAARIFNLQRISFPKYITCLAALPRGRRPVGRMEAAWS